MASDLSAGVSSVVDRGICPHFVSRVLTDESLSFDEPIDPNLAVSCKCFESNSGFEAVHGNGIECHSFSVACKAVNY